jgi:hypothetical protein
MLEYGHFRHAGKSMPRKQGDVMKKILVTTVVLIFIAVMGPASVQLTNMFPAAPLYSWVVQANETKCSLGSLNGAYSFSGQGEMFVGNEHAVEGDAGTLMFDGKGNFTGQGAFSLNGETLLTKLVGTYTVSSDCTTSALFTNDAGELIHEIGVVVDGGRQSDFIETDPGVAIWRVARRIDDESSSAQ